MILACPLNPQTHRLVDGAALRALKPHARLVNVARGEVVDEVALVEALVAGHLAGAFLDVFALEPLASASPLWGLPGVIVTPHSAGHAAGNAARVAAIFVDNLRRWLQDQPLQNAID